MAKISKSWFRDDTPGLIARKKVDWSVFNIGCHIPVEYHEYFKEANDGILPERGQNDPVQLLIDNTKYEAVLINVDRQGITADTLQLHYKKNLKKLMTRVFQTSYHYLKGERAKRRKEELNDIAVPDDMAEFIEFYSTETPFEYRLKLINQPNAGVVQEETTSDRMESMAKPFSSIFIDKEEALWAFDMMAGAAEMLGIDSANDERLAITIRHKNMGLHFNFGNWLLLGFYGPKNEKGRLRLPLLEETEMDKLHEPFRFAQNQDEPATASYLLPMKKPSENIKQRYMEAMKHISIKFRNYKKSPYRKYHIDRIAKAIFDRQLRMKLLAEGLDYAQVDMPDNEFTPAQEPVYINMEYSLDELAADTGIDQEELERWVKAIERKGQAILYGPPGTGKTFLARGLAKHMIGGSDGFVDLVQFHPAYAYEDFIQGIRPKVDGDGVLKYPVVPGRLLEFCQRARAKQGRCVLIIDEINRANLSRVFGELMYLLEYRDAAIPLAGGGTFRLPGNVRIIGTMNTADRSIALVDFALRRRFAFIPLQPNYEILRRYHSRTGIPVEGLIETLVKLNRRINDSNYEIGVSFFLRKDLDDQLEDIWCMEIEPYIEELFYDQPEKVDDFRWDKIQEKVQS
ncbi:hypothetical protein JCM39194_20210 [Desulfotomaculum varum]